MEASSLSLSQTNLNACGQSNQDSSKAKWPCPRCTYLNWPRSIRCVQCYTRRNDDIVSESNLIQEQLRSLNITDSDPDLVASSKSASSRLSPVGSVTNLASSKYFTGAVGNNRISPIENRPPYVNKWVCNVSNNYIYYNS